MIGWDGYFPSMLRPWISLANEATLLQISKDMALSRQISQFNYCGHVNEKKMIFHWNCILFSDTSKLRLNQKMRKLRVLILIKPGGLTLSSWYNLRLVVVACLVVGCTKWSNGCTLVSQTFQSCQHNSDTTHQLCFDICLLKMHKIWGNPLTLSNMLYECV